MGDEGPLVSSRSGPSATAGLPAEVVAQPVQPGLILSGRAEAGSLIGSGSSSLSCGLLGPLGARHGRAAHVQTGFTTPV